MKGNVRKSWMYKGDDAQIFEGEEAIEKAEKEGWKDTPGSVEKKKPAKKKKEPTPDIAPNGDGPE